MRGLMARIFASILLAAAAPALAAGGLDRIVAGKTLTVAVAQNAPWVIRKPDGSFVGYDIDLVNAMAKDLGVTARFVETPFDQLVSKVATNNADLAAAGLAISPDKALQVVFSSPTGFAVIRTVAAGADGHRIAPGGAGTTIAVLAGSADEAAARRFYPKATILTFPDSNAAMSALIDGRARAMVARSPVPRLATHLFDKHLKLVGPPIGKTAEALALRPDDDRLQAYVNNWLAARAADGTLANLREHWFARFDWINAMQPMAPKPGR